MLLRMFYRLSVLCWPPSLCERAADKGNSTHAASVPQSVNLKKLSIAIYWSYI
ncbi:hypothetical protein BV347_04238 [Pseudomonas syringae pv. actinidiae]|nr:hypothetical protein [Pseudomonas savastanoi pv. phaseolicola]OSN57903.1 hypothetical protein BV347_04238 [Pseudomonas syringae pv. actinidiae]OSN68223.1 hypothetical protein BV350_04176 [Pseudomonas syringae pv. actinidiae]OSN97891.1 hypothetical protein BV355_04213 [Pseudomonas syringae pv. actinidiae]OSO09255.1 hypothetical protein BV357_04187 [Pseudomonas syringae pv. actinidiae]